MCLANVPSAPSLNTSLTVWLENTDYSMAIADRMFPSMFKIRILINAANLQWIASQDISLINYMALTHPSQPNHVAAVGGDTQQISNDNFHRIDPSVQTIVDLLDAKDQLE
jgi:hypothetical protein